MDYGNGWYDCLAEARWAITNTLNTTENEEVKVGLELALKLLDEL